MNNDNYLPPSTPLPSSKLTRLCLDQTSREEAHLQQTLTVLQAVRAALLDSDNNALHQAFQQQQEVANASERLAQHRSEFRQEAATLLNLSPSDITLGRLSSLLPDDISRELDERRERLRLQAEEVDQLNRKNASLLHSCLDFFENVFQDLTGREPDGRYGRAGSVADSTCGCIIDTRG